MKKKQLMETGLHSEHFTGLTLSGTHSLCYGPYSISYGAKSLHWFIDNCTSLCNDVQVNISLLNTHKFLRKFIHSLYLSFNIPDVPANVLLWWQLKEGSKNKRK